jgi:anti-sigma B factor antagonist
MSLTQPEGRDKLSPDLTITERQVDDVLILDLTGKIVLGGTSVDFREHIKKTKSKNILLNMANVTYIDHNGIGELVNAFTTVTNQGGRLKLLNLGKRTEDLLRITKLYTVFEVFTDEAQALKSFR